MIAQEGRKHFIAEKQHLARAAIDFWMRGHTAREFSRVIKEAFCLKLSIQFIGKPNLRQG